MANTARSVVDVGSVIADTYKIEGLIGRGGMGAVFLASHNRLPGKRVAIKVLHAEVHDEELLARFRREAQIASMLGHPNIVGVHDFNVTPDGMPYLVLDYLEGETLAHKLQRGPLTVDQISSILRQVGSALAAAHREGVVHRDLKPQNIFLVPTEVDGKLVEIAKVLDFGISKWRGSQTVKTQESALLGTPQYMAPEQATGKHDSVDARTDVFALGAIVHEMLAGQPAFSGASIPEVVFKVVYEEPTPLPTTLPASIAAAVTRAMAKAPEARFASVGDFVEAVTGQPLTTTARGTTPVPELGAAALAHTMDSGNHAGKLVDVSAPTIDSQRGSVPATASVAAQATLAGVAASSTAQRTSNTAVAPPTTPTTPETLAGPAVAATSSKPAPTERSTELDPASTAAAPPRKHTGLIVGLVACLAAGGVIAALTLRGEGERPKAAKVAGNTPPAEAPTPSMDGTSANKPVAVNSAGADKPGDDKPADGKAAADSAAVDSPAGDKPALDKLASGKPTAGKPTAGKPTAPSGDPDAEPADRDGPREVAALLEQATRAFRAGDTQQALRLSNDVINQGNPLQAAKAHVLRGKIHCQTGDFEGFNVELRQLDAFPRLEQRLRAACRQ